MAFKIGFGQINKPTPASLNRWVRGLNVASVFFIGWMATATIMGPHTKDAVNQILSLFVGAINLLSPLVGAQNIHGTVPVKDVTAVETK